MLEALFDRVGGPAFSLAVRILGNPEVAEEIVGSVFTQVKGELDTANYEVDRLGARVLSLVRQRAIVRRHSDRASRGLGTKGERAAVEIPDPAHGRRLPLLTDAQRSQLRRSLAELPAAERSAVELAFFEGLTQDDLAEKLNLTVEAVRQRVTAGLRTLRDDMRVVP